MEKNTEMELFISKLISSVVQIILFSLIPFLWWLVTARKKEKLFMLYSMKGVEMATSDFAGLEVNALPAILVYANEKKAGGSIIPGWCIHAMANIFSGACAAFSLF